MEAKLRGKVRTIEQQYGFTPGRIAVDEVFALSVDGEVYREGLALCIRGLRKEENMTWR